MFISILNNVKQTESDLKSVESKNIIKNSLLSDQLSSFTIIS